MPTIKLEVISPDALVYQEDISMLVVNTPAGELGILPHHLPMIAGLLPCAMRIKREAGNEMLSISGGFMEVQPDKITVLTPTAETASSIDAERAQKSYDRAKERIHNFNTSPSQYADIDVERAELSMKRAIARLKTAGAFKG